MLKLALPTGFLSWLMIEGCDTLQWETSTGSWLLPCGLAVSDELAARAIVDGQQLRNAHVAHHLHVGDYEPRSYWVLMESTETGDGYESLWVKRTYGCDCKLRVTETRSGG